MNDASSRDHSCQESPENQIATHRRGLSFHPSPDIAESHPRPTKTVLGLARSRTPNPSWLYLGDDGIRPSKEINVVADVELGHLAATVG